MNLRWICLVALILGACTQSHTAGESGRGDASASPADDPDASRLDGAVDAATVDTATTCRYEQFTGTTRRGVWVQWQRASDGRLLWAEGTRREGGPAVARLDVRAWHGTRTARAETTDEGPLDFGRVRRRVDEFEHLSDGRPLSVSVTISGESEPASARTRTTRYVYESDQLRELVHEIDGRETERGSIAVDLSARTATLETRGIGDDVRTETVTWNAAGSVTRVRSSEFWEDRERCTQNDFTYDDDGNLLGDEWVDCSGTAISYSYTWQELSDRVRYQRTDVTGGSTGAISVRIDWMRDSPTARLSITRDGIFDDDVYQEITGCVGEPVRRQNPDTLSLDLEPFRLAGAPLAEDPPLIPTLELSPFI